MPTRSLCRWIAVLAAVGVLAAGCSTERKTNTSSGGSGKGGSSNQFPTTATGVTADKIKIGVSYFYLGPLYKAGIIKVDEGPWEQVAKVLVDDINKKGGVDGRKLELSTAKFFTPDNTSAAAACAQLTEDTQNFAVLGGFIGDQNVCVPQQHSTILVSGFSGYSKAQADKARALGDVAGQRRTLARCPRQAPRPERQTQGQEDRDLRPGGRGERPRRHRRQSAQGRRLRGHRVGGQRRAGHRHAGLQRGGEGARDALQGQGHRARCSWPAERRLAPTGTAWASIRRCTCRPPA